MSADNSVKWLDNIHLFPQQLPGVKANIPNYGTITKQQLRERFASHNKCCKFTNITDKHATCRSDSTVGTEPYNNDTQASIKKDI